MKGELDNETYEQYRSIGLLRVVNRDQQSFRV